MSIVDGKLTSGGGKCEPWLLDRSRALLGIRVVERVDCVSRIA